MPRRSSTLTTVALALGLAASPLASWARIPLEEPVPGGRRGAGPEALPDIFGPGAVLNVGNIHMKVTNDGFVGNPFTALSSDPSGQWPGASGVEYLNFLGLGVGAVNLRAAEPTGVRRVSFATEWRPKTLDPEDRIYRGFDGVVNGTRLFNDDNDFDPITGEQKIDEDFLDGRDNDGDGRVDEDFGALGQQMFSFAMWDNTVEAINTTRNEKHVPLGLECRQKAWAYSIRGFQDFNVLEYQIFNRSGHTLDSLTVGFLPDMDAGPIEVSNFFSDDFDLPNFPSGDFVIRVGGLPGDLRDPKRLQHPHDSQLDNSVPAESALCPRVTLRVNGFSLGDDDGDEQRTNGIASVLLIDHTIDPLGISGPSRVGWKSFRSFTAGTPFTGGGNPTIDQQRFEFLTGSDNVDPETGFITALAGETKGDYAQWCSVGPWRNVPDGGSVTVTIAFAIREGRVQDARQYSTDYARYQAGAITAVDLMDRYPVLANAIAAQVAFEGVHERRDGFAVPDYHGRETGIRLPIGSPPQQMVEDCPGRQVRVVTVNDRDYTWFDFDCDYCTGVWNSVERGFVHKHWNAEAPPPNPNLNVSPSHNFSDNPERSVIPSGDRQITLAWDNLSEVTPDPKSQWFDFRGYSVWKVSDWKRPVGSPGPSETEWQLLGQFRLFEYRTLRGEWIERNYTIDPVTGDKICPEVFVPNHVYYDSLERRFKQGKAIPICLDRGDLWDKQSGAILKPDPTFPCVPSAESPDGCARSVGCILNASPCTAPSNQMVRRHYPIGRYRYVDRDVKNGFVYFYSVTAFDSVTDQSVTTELHGRRSAVEAEGVSPQASVRPRGGVWVVPNPYRGYSRIADRPSAWDLTPNASDPTGTHIDFMGLPANGWTIRIYTVSGDLVAVLHSGDEVNESIRPPVKVGNREFPGFNRQQDNPNDGQARWNLISRNGQDVVSGVYLFAVESAEGTQRGRFVIIR